MIQVLYIYIIFFWRGAGRGFPVGSAVKNLPANAETPVPSLGREDPLDWGMAIHSSILAWRIPWTGEPGRLQSMGLQRLKQVSMHTYTHTHTHTHIYIRTHLYVYMSDKETWLSIAYLVFYILFYYGLSQDIRYSSPCYIVRPCLPILNIIAYIS